MVVTTFDYSDFWLNGHICSVDGRSCIVVLQKTGNYTLRHGNKTSSHRSLPDSQHKMRAGILENGRALKNELGLLQEAGMKKEASMNIGVRKPLLLMICVFVEEVS